MTLKLLKTLLAIIGIVVVVGCAAVFAWVRFEHPELTETQLFLKNWWLVVYAVMGFGFFGVAIT